MTAPFKVAAGLALAGLLVGFPVMRSFGQDDDKKDKPLPGKGAWQPLPKEIDWRVKMLDQAPLKVVSAQYNPKNGVVFWVLELVRDLNVYEDGGYWAPAFKDGRRTRFHFEFHDANGIVVKEAEAKYYGEYVTKAGKRFGVILELPLEQMAFIKTIEAVGK